MDVFERKANEYVDIFFADTAIDFKPVVKVNGEDPKRFMKDVDYV